MSEIDVNTIKYSIIVPVYKTEKYIEECIQSVLKQLYNNWELILVDDGSPDSSGSICDYYAKQDDRIVVVHKDNGGQLSARVAGLGVASGDYIMFLDSDDWYDCDAVQVVNDVIQQFQCDCVIFGYRSVAEDGSVLEVHCDSEVSIISDKQAIYRKCLFTPEYNSLGRKVIKRNVISCIDYTKYYQYRIAEDKLQSVDIYKNCNEIIFFPCCTYNYRQNPGSVMNSIGINNYQYYNTYEIEKYIIKFLSKEPDISENFIEKYKYCKLVEFCNDCLKICGFSRSIIRRVQLLSKIRNSDYYCVYLGNVNLDFRMYDTKLIIAQYAIKYHLYAVLVFAVDIKAVVRKLKSWSTKLQRKK